MFTEKVLRQVVTIWSEFHFMFLPMLESLFGMSEQRSSGAIPTYFLDLFGMTEEQRQVERA